MGSGATRTDKHNQHFLILAACHSSLVLIVTKTWIFMRHFLILPHQHPRSWYFTLRSNLTCKPGAPPLLHNVIHQSQSSRSSFLALNDFVQYQEYQEYKTYKIFSSTSRLNRNHKARYKARSVFKYEIFSGFRQTHQGTK